MQFLKLDYLYLITIIKNNHTRTNCACLFVFYELSFFGPSCRILLISDDLTEAIIIPNEAEPISLSNELI